MKNLLFCVALLASIPEPTFSYNTEGTEADTALKQNADTLLFKDRKATEKWLQKNKIPVLAIGYISEGKIMETTVYGRNTDAGPAPGNIIFNVASLTKPVTALVALKLVNAGKWDVDETLYKYWLDPDIANDPRAKKLTTRHVLSHQTGFPNWRWKTPGGRLAFEFEPGTRYQYSGEGFEYLRKALEKKFGKKLEQLAKELIFDPLAMKDTRFYWDDAMDSNRFAKWHRADGTVYSTYKNDSANAADDLLTTIEDYSKFVLHILNGAGLSKELYREMISRQVQIKPRKYWGLGFWVDEAVKKGENVLINGGDDIGVHCIVFMFPESKEGLLIFTNSDNGTDIYIPAVLHYLGEAGQEIINIETQN